MDLVDDNRRGEWWMVVDDNRRGEWWIWMMIIEEVIRLVTHQLSSLRKSTPH